MMDIQGCYHTLGLELGASQEAVKHARMFFIQVYHPDRYAHNQSLQKEAEEKLKKVNVAYDAIVKHMKQGLASDSSRTNGTSATSPHERPTDQARKPKKEPKEENREKTREKHQDTRSDSSDDESRADASEREQKRQNAARQAYKETKRSSLGLFKNIGYLLRTFVLGILLGVPTAQLAAEMYYKGIPSTHRTATIYVSYYNYLKESILKKGGVGSTYVFSKTNGGNSAKGDRKKEGRN